MERYVLRVPDVGEGATEAEIVVWHVQPGEFVAEDQPVVDLMTDKATFEVTAPVSGRVLTTRGRLGEKIAIASELIVFQMEQQSGAAVESAPAAAVQSEAPVHMPAPQPLAASRAASVAAAVAEPAPAARQTRSEKTPARERPLASPAVRQKAWEAGIELQFVAGSGPSGRIAMDDLERHMAAGRSAPARGGSFYSSDREKNGIEEIRIIGLRRQIAERMQEAKRRIPHFSYVEAVDVTELEATREHLNATRSAERPKLTPLPFIIRALVRACAGYPQINAHFDDDAGILYRHEAVHVGIAVQTAAGLMVPVVRHAEARDLWDSAAEIARLAALAREKNAAREELSGSTITISSLGALGGIVTTPIVNRPEVAIVGINKIVEQPVVRGGCIAIRKMMNLSSSFDHRVVDGAIAAEFIQKVKALLETPAALFVE